MRTTRTDLTFKHNLKRNRHGWLRLTPAYSVKVVNDILDQHPHLCRILDPFSGTGTTALVAAERGGWCDAFDINPFLIWLGSVKTCHYDPLVIAHAHSLADEVRKTALTLLSADDLWVPSIHNIARWWSVDAIQALSCLYAAIKRVSAGADDARNLLLIAFCQKVIAWSNAAFNHQSMSFKDHSDPGLTLLHVQDMIHDFYASVENILESAQMPLSGTARFQLADARAVPPPNPLYDCVITSPPYPNRMSYIRELRPYMYWLEYLTNAQQAGELDWQAIGGTWGIATSRVAHWTSAGSAFESDHLQAVVESIAAHSQVLAKYVHKYFVDMSVHFESLFPAVAPFGKIFYVVGNSKFYDTLVPVEHLYAVMMEGAGFQNISIVPLRKRSSKKELFEYLITAEKPA
ncbi:MAG: SAM-dependent methyltransferase [bacterium]|nr:SAM-dependent methyltransferase [bacterium]